VHLGVLLNQYGNHKSTLRDSRVSLDIRSDEGRRDLRLFG
jgi:hypothetical protein